MDINTRLNNLSSRRYDRAIVGDSGIKSLSKSLLFENQYNFSSLAEKKK